MFLFSRWRPPCLILKIWNCLRFSTRARHFHKERLTNVFSVAYFVKNTIVSASADYYSRDELLLQSWHSSVHCFKSFCDFKKSSLKLGNSYSQESPSFSKCGDHKNRVLWVDYSKCISSHQTASFEPWTATNRHTVWSVLVTSNHLKGARSHRMARSYLIAGMTRVVRSSPWVLTVKT